VDESDFVALECGQPPAFARGTVASAAQALAFALVAAPAVPGRAERPDYAVLIVSASVGRMRLPATGSEGLRDFRRVHALSRACQPTAFAHFRRKRRADLGVRPARRPATPGRGERSDHAGR